MKPPFNRKWHGWRNFPWPKRQTVFVLLLYMALTVVMTWPIAGRLGSYVPGRNGDTWIHLWTFRWIKDALLSGHSPYFTNLLYYPTGSSLIFHNIAWVNIAAWLPLQAIFGEGTAYSLLYLAVIAFNGFATYLLLRYLTGSTLAAFVGGAVVAFWPNILSHSDRTNLILIAWIPLALLYLKRFFDHKRVQDAVFAGIFIALIGLTRWQLLVMAAPLIGLMILYQLFTDRTNRTPRSLGLLALSGLLALLIMSPFLLPILDEWFTFEEAAELLEDEQSHLTDLVAYLVPGRYHPIWGSAIAGFYNRFPTPNSVFYVGITSLLLLILGLTTRWPQTRIWLLAVLLYLILALGPELHINGAVFRLPMPYSLVAESSFIKLIKKPVRFNVLLSIPIAVIVAYGTDTLLQRFRTRWQKVALTSILVVLILFEYITIYPMFPLESPAWYSELAQESGQFGLLDIPMFPNSVPNKAYMHYQSVHGKPIVQGHVSRTPSEATSFISQVLLLRKVRFEKMEVLANEIVNVSEQLRQLAEANIRYLVLHKNLLPQSELVSWRQWLAHQPYYEDDELVVYRTDPQLGRDFQIAHDLTAGPGGEPELSLVRTTITPTIALQGSTISVGANWYAWSDVEHDYEICLSLIDAGQGPAQSTCEPIAPTWPTGRWRADELFYTNYQIDLSPYLPRGTYKLSLSLLDSPGGEVAGQPALVGELVYDAIPRVFTTAEPQVTTNYTWDDVISLRGYDLSYLNDGSLAIHPYWQALRRMDTSFTNFFHLIDPGSGQIVAQADVIPRGWTYPTNWWEQGEVVEDTVVLPLEEVLPGEYDLYVGWYDIDTGQRVPVHSQTGDPIADNSVLLTTVER